MDGDGLIFLIWYSLVWFCLGACFGAFIVTISVQKEDDEKKKEG